MNGHVSNQGTKCTNAIAEPKVRPKLQAWRHFLFAENTWTILQSTPEIRRQAGVPQKGSWVCDKKTTTAGPRATNIEDKSLITYPPKQIGDFHCSKLNSFAWSLPAIGQFLR